MEQLTVSFISLLAGAMLGLGTSLVASILKQRQDVVLKLVDQYLEVRQEVVGSVSNLTHMDNRLELSKAKRAKLRSEIGKLFYKHYDFLPKEVLDAILLLDICLSDQSGGLYKVEGNSIVPLADSEIVQFIDRCSLYENARFIAPLALRSSDPAVRCNQAIKLHARHVLYTLNQFASLSDMITMARRFSKSAKITTV